MPENVQIIRSIALPAEEKPETVKEKKKFLLHQKGRVEIEDYYQRDLAGNIHDEFSSEDFMSHDSC